MALLYNFCDAFDCVFFIVIVISVVAWWELEYVLCDIYLFDVEGNCFAEDFVAGLCEVYSILLQV